MATRRLAKPRPVQGEQAPPAGGPPRSRVRRSSRRETGGLDGWSPSTESGLQACYGEAPLRRGFVINRFPLDSSSYALRDTHNVRKTSVYLTERESKRLADLARSEGRSQAEIIREAITAYIPTSRGDRDFALAVGFARIDDDPRPISEIPEDELLAGFGK